MCIVTILNPLTECGFNCFFRIVGDYLKFVECYDAGLSGVFQIFEYFIKKHVWGVYIADRNTPLWHTVDVERHSHFKRFENVGESFPHLSAKRFQCFEHAFTEFVGEFCEIFGVVDINIESVVVFLNILLIKKVMY